MAEVLTFSTIFSTKETDDVWDFKEEDSHGDGGANVQYTNIYWVMQRLWDLDDLQS